MLIRSNGTLYVICMTVWCPIIPLIIYVEHLTITRNKREQYELLAVPIGKIYLYIKCKYKCKRNILCTRMESVSTVEYCWSAWIFAVCCVCGFFSAFFFKVNEYVRMQNTQWIRWCHGWGWSVWNRRCDEQVTTTTTANDNDNNANNSNNEHECKL